MDRYVYFVRLRFRRISPLLAFLDGINPIPSFETTVAMGHPVFDDDDLAELKRAAIRAAFKEQADVVDEERVTLLNVSFLHSYNTKFHDPWLRAKDRAREDARRGHPQWWRGPKRTAAQDAEENAL